MLCKSTLLFSNTTSITFYHNFSYVQKFFSFWIQHLICLRNSINKMNLIDKCNIRWETTYLTSHSFSAFSWKEILNAMTRNHVLIDRCWPILWYADFGSAPQINLTHILYDEMELMNFPSQHQTLHTVK